MSKQYRISEFADLVQVTPYTIRYYEKEGLLEAHKVGGQRVYNDDDVLWFQFLQHLKGAGFSLYEMREYVQWRSQGDATIPNRQKLLETKQVELEEKIRDKQRHLEIVKDKIAFYQQKVGAKQILSVFVSNIMDQKVSIWFMFFS